MTKEEVLNFITSRRSIRNFTSEPVSEEDLMIILKSAMAAPSARNVQPWSFVTVQDRNTLNKLSEAHPYGKMLSEATLAIAVTGASEKTDWWTQDCSAATQNILLAASGLGLGSVWLGVHPRPDRVKALREILGIPQEIQVLSLVAIGHPTEKRPGRTQYDPEKVHRDKW
jgi:nitroreductase